LIFAETTKNIKINVTYNKTTDDGQLVYDEPVRVYNNNGLVREEIEYEMTTQLEEQQEIKPMHRSPPEIEVLFWFRYFAFTFN